MYDVIIIGGSYAGLSAALQLARARRRVLVIDEGRRRNRFAAHSHGFLGQDGRDAGEIAADGRAQLMKYPTVTWLDGRAEEVNRWAAGYTVTDSKGGSHESRRLILATGVSDTLPDVPGLAERWGKHVFHCPYCHGYELDQGAIGVLASSEVSMHHALMLPDWGQVTFFLNGAFEPSAEDLSKLQARGVAVERTGIRELAGDGIDVVLEDGRTIPLAGLFTITRTEVRSPIARALGCEFEEGPLGDFIKTDLTQETSIKGIFACGDAARPSGSVALAVGEGAMAGVAAHRSIMFE